jgi:hypothetical protein
MRSLRGAAALAAFVAVVLQAGPASGETEEHCVSLLEPVAVKANVIEATPVEVGCYPTYAEALAAGSGGTIAVDATTSPSSLTDDELSASLLEAQTGTVLIGTEWIETGYASTSHSYFATVTCSGVVSWEVGYVTDQWNDRFESGKGFGGCDRNRKFADSQFGGASILCTPNCSTYGSLNNLVSSLRWRA